MPLKLKRSQRQSCGGPHTDSVGSASLTGTWWITGMEMWGEDYLHRETQICIRIGEDRSRDFQFDLVSGSVDEHVDEVSSESQFTFTWEKRDRIHPFSRGDSSGPQETGRPRA